MVTIQPEFKDERDRIIAFTTILTSMFFVFVPPLLVVFFAKDYVSDSTYKIAKAFLNFELLLFLVGLISIIPIIGWIIGAVLIPILIIYNVMVVVINILALGKNAEIKVPVGYEFI